MTTALINALLIGTAILLPAFWLARRHSKQIVNCLEEKS